MPRPRKKNTETSDKVKFEVKEVISDLTTTPEMIEDPSSMPLETLSDYIRYNRAARATNKRLKIARYPIKPVPIALHPKQKVVFRRNDQPSNPLAVKKDDDMINFEETLYPGRTYNLPTYIIQYLANKGTPVWKWYDKPDGSRETGIDHYKPRFSLTPLYD